MDYHVYLLINRNNLIDYFNKNTASRLLEIMTLTSNACLNHNLDVLLFTADAEMEGKE
jgi:hypothetical protein